MMNLNGGYVMLDLNAKGLYAKAEALIGIDKPILLYPLNNATPYYINKIAKVTEEGTTYINVNDEYKIASDGTITPIEPEPQTLPIATASVLGGVKIGSGINVTEDGTISVTGGTQHLYKHNVKITGDSSSGGTAYIILIIYNTSDVSYNEASILTLITNTYYNVTNGYDSETTHGIYQIQYASNVINIFEFDDSSYTINDNFSVNDVVTQIL